MAFSISTGVAAAAAVTASPACSTSSNSAQKPSVTIALPRTFMNSLSLSSHGVPAASRRQRLCIACSSSQPSAPSTEKMDEYNRIMQRKMRSPYEYHHDLGIYFTRIVDNVIVGSQPQTPEDIERIYHKEGVRAILNLQQDKDVVYWGIDFASIRKKCEELGIDYLRAPAIDFDPNSLRHELPKAVSLLEKAVSEGKTVYVHCTAGLGRAPAVVIAYLFWFQNMNLNKAYEFLTSKRPCGPRKEAIRAATYDLGKLDPDKEPFESLPENAFTDVAPLERETIQKKIRALRE